MTYKSNRIQSQIKFKVITQITVSWGPRARFCIIAAIPCIVFIFDTGFAQNIVHHQSHSLLPDQPFPFFSSIKLSRDFCFAAVFLRVLFRMYHTKMHNEVAALVTVTDTTCVWKFILGFIPWGIILLAMVTTMFWSPLSIRIIITSHTYDVSFVLAFPTKYPID